MTDRQRAVGKMIELGIPFTVTNMLAVAFEWPLPGEIEETRIVLEKIGKPWTEDSIREARKSLLEALK